MKFSQAGGNTQVLKALSGMVDSGHVPHAIMFSEKDGGGAFRVAMAFLQYLYCSNRTAGDSCGTCLSCNKVSKLIHPDIHFIFPTKSGSVSENYIRNFRELAVSNPDFTEQDMMDSLGVDVKNVLIPVSEAKALLETMSLSSLEGSYKSAVILYPEKMNADTGNKLLKLVEEPPASTQFVFITHAPEKVLKTISSRCQRFTVQPPAASSLCAVAFPDPALFYDYLNALLSGKLYPALEISERIAALPSRESAKAFCRFAVSRLRDIFLLQQGMDSLVADPEPVRKQASSCRRTFARTASSAFDNAVRLIDRNVNMKLVFTDLTDRLFFEITRK